MNDAIENHVVEHFAEKEYTTKDADQIRDCLIIQVFEKAGKQQNQS
jgi:hypothetical protein